MRNSDSQAFVVDVFRVPINTLQIFRFDTFTKVSNGIPYSRFLHFFRWLLIALFYAGCTMNAVESVFIIYFVYKFSFAGSKLVDLRYMLSILHYPLSKTRFFVVIILFRFQSGKFLQSFGSGISQITEHVSSVDPAWRNRVNLIADSVALASTFCIFLAFGLLWSSHSFATGQNLTDYTTIFLPISIPVPFWIMFPNFFIFAGFPSIIEGQIILIFMLDCIFIFSSIRVDSRNSRSVSRLANLIRLVRSHTKELARNFSSYFVVHFTFHIFVAIG